MISMMEVIRLENKEQVLTLLLIECVRRLTKNGKNNIHITNGQLKKIVAEGLEIDFSGSDSDKFVFRLVEAVEQDKEDKEEEEE
jgi:hypothetical protein